MSSPAASSTAGAAPKEKKPLEQITFRFCSECSNMLYPRESENENKLLFTCRTCNFSEDATSSCIYRNILNNAAGVTAGVTQDVGSDPTVSIADFIFLDDDEIDELVAVIQNAGPDSELPAPVSGHMYVFCHCCGLIEMVPLDDIDEDTALDMDIDEDTALDININIQF